MNLAKRVLLGVGIVLLDAAVFFLPLAAFFLAYILIFNPPWFREFLSNSAKKNRVPKAQTS